jgi:hypothetical protein
MSVSWQKSSLIKNRFPRGAFQTERKIWTQRNIIRNCLHSIFVCDLLASKNSCGIFYCGFHAHMSWSIWHHLNHDIYSFMFLHHSIPLLMLAKCKFSHSNVFLFDSWMLWRNLNIFACLLNPGKKIEFKWDGTVLDGNSLETNKFHLNWFPYDMLAWIQVFHDCECETNNWMNVNLCILKIRSLNINSKKNQHFGYNLKASCFRFIRRKINSPNWSIHQLVTKICHYTSWNMQTSFYLKSTKRCWCL